MEYNLYFDNAATSFPKPPETAFFISNYLNIAGGTYGRSSYERVIRATSFVEDCRDEMAKILGTRLYDHIFFCQNATMGANTLLQGLSLQRGRILISPLFSQINGISTIFFLQVTKVCSARREPAVSSLEIPKRWPPCYTAARAATPTVTICRTFCRTSLKPEHRTLPEYTDYTGH